MILTYFIIIKNIIINNIYLFSSINQNKIIKIHLLNNKIKNNNYLYYIIIIK